LQATRLRNIAKLNEELRDLIYVGRGMAYNDDIENMKRTTVIEEIT